MRIVEEADLAIIVGSFPETGAAPVNRQLERFRWQQEGLRHVPGGWDAATPVGYVFVRGPTCGGGGDGLTDQALALGCPELGDLFVVEQARGRGIGRKLVETAESVVAARGLVRVGLSGYTYWDAAGAPQRDEELHRYLVKQLDSTR